MRHEHARRTLEYHRMQGAADREQGRQLRDARVAEHTACGRTLRCVGHSGTNAARPWHVPMHPATEPCSTVHHHLGACSNARSTRTGEVNSCGTSIYAEGLK